MHALNLSEARFMKSFKALFQKLTDLVCIILRLFPSFIYHLYNISSVPTSCNVSLIRDMSQT